MGIGDENQQKYIDMAIERMLAVASENGFPKDRYAELCTLVHNSSDIFRISFSTVPPGRLPPLRISLTEDAKPFRVRLRNYFQDQHEFLQIFISELVRCKMVYPNPSARWAAAPLL